MEIPHDESESLLSLLFGSNPNPEDVDRWKSQGWTMSQEIPFVIHQSHGGPCGILAPVQAFLLKKLIFENQEGLSSIERLRLIDPKILRDSLESVLLIMLKRAVPDHRNPIKLIKLRENHSFQSADSIDLNQSTVLDFAASLVRSRGIDQVKLDMDDPEIPLIGRFGHCSQELLNLVLFGQARSNVFDGDQKLGDDIMILRGVPSEADIDVGLLSELEALRYVTVGSKLKNPKYPFWIIGSPSHYTLLFSFDKSCSSRSRTESQQDLIRAKFNEFSMDDGIALAENFPKMIKALGLSDTVLSDSSAKSFLVEEVIIYDDFYKWVVEFLPSVSENAEKISDSNLQFVFINGQNPVQVLHVATSREPVLTACDIAGSLERIVRTRWPNLHLRIVNQLS